MSPGSDREPGWPVSWVPPNGHQWAPATSSRLPSRAGSSPWTSSKPPQLQEEQGNGATGLEPAASGVTGASRRAPKGERNPGSQAEWCTSRQSAGLRPRMPAICGRSRAIWALVPIARARTKRHTSHCDRLRPQCEAALSPRVVSGAGRRTTRAIAPLGDRPYGAGRGHSSKLSWDGRRVLVAHLHEPDTELARHLDQDPDAGQHV